jgi:hypothetical protein
MTDERPDGTAGWDDHRHQQLVDWLTTSPAQRLAWLERAIAFAVEAGALPGREPDATDAHSGTRSSPGTSTP